MFSFNDIEVTKRIRVERKSLRHSKVPPSTGNSVNNGSVSNGKSNTPESTSDVKESETVFGPMP